jgi:hypothetical protein
MDYFSLTLLCVSSLVICEVRWVEDGRHDMTAEEREERREKLLRTKGLEFGMILELEPRFQIASTAGASHWHLILSSSSLALSSDYHQKLQ